MKFQHRRLTDRTLCFEALEARRVLSGDTTTQGDMALYTDVVREAFAVYGTGVKIGVISDNYNKLGGANNDIASGDLPGPNNPFGYTQPVNVRNDPNVSAPSDEGRAMLQIIHDIAPAAELFFYGLGQGWTEDQLATAIKTCAIKAHTSSSMI